MRRFTIGMLIVVGSLVTLLSGTVRAGNSLEQELAGDLATSRTQLVRLAAHLDTPVVLDTVLSQFQSTTETLTATHLLLLARFDGQTARLETLGETVLARHQAMADDYRRRMGAYLERASRLQTVEDLSADILGELLDLLDDLITPSARPVYGSLPYHHPTLSAVAPSLTPVVVPAYAGGDQTVTDDDTRDTDASPISQPIAELAESLDWEPAAIYAWVKNNIRTEWYWGCMKGAEDTLRQGSGNDADQAALLVALLRSGGYPARFVRGVIEFFPDLSAVMAQTGCQTTDDISDFFTRAGIPFAPVMDGSNVVNFRIEHVWVAARVPYGNYRGALVDESGNAWLGLDTSIKNSGYTTSTPAPVLDSFSLTDVRHDYLAAVQSELPLAWLEDRIQTYLDANAPGTTYADTLLTRVQNTEVLPLLPASLQFTTVGVTAEATALPDDLIHKVRLQAVDGASTTLFDVTLETFRVSNRSLAVTYEAETIEDQETINAYGGLDNTPGYLIRLRPVLTLDGQRQAVGQAGLASGETFSLTVAFSGPGTAAQATNALINGNFSVLGIVAQDGALMDTVAVEDKDAERLFYETAVDYAANWYDSEDRLAELLQVAVVRPLPSLVTVGGVVVVDYLLGQPHGFDIRGAYVDADLRTADAVGGTSLADASDPRMRFMQLSALEGSALESQVLEDNLTVESVSTTRLIGLAQTNGMTLLTIDAANAASVIPTLPFDTGVIDDISAAVNDGAVVTVPDAIVAIEDWTGIGYIKENQTTGEAGWMLSGSIAGGMTAWGMDRWDEYYRERMENPFSEPANDDPSAAVAIQKVSGTDVQMGTAGEALPGPLQVVALDMDQRPVRGAAITFVAMAGGATFGSGQGSITVETNYNGIASVPVVLGKHTADNATLWWEDGYTHNMQVGENIIDARLASGTQLRVPFTAYGFPGAPAAIVKTYGDNKWNSILNWAGFVKVRVEDANGNPISNLPVDFTVGAAVDNSTCTNPNQDTRPTVLVEMDDPCVDNLPSYGECGTAAGSKQVISSYTGAGVQVVMGGTPEADHPISVSVSGLSASFTLHTYAFGNCSGSTPPAKAFALQISTPSDSYGVPINAAPPGGTVPLQARLKVRRENEKEEDYTFSCDGSSVTCTRIVGDRTYYLDTGFSSSSVSFGGTGGTSLGDGRFSADYTVSAGVNHVTVSGNGSIDYRYSVTSCSGCSIENGTYSDSGSLTTVVYGVEFDIKPEIMVAVDADGYATCDVPIEYTIRPAEYTASSAGVYIYKDGNTIAYMPSELSGEGSATLSRGFLFDTNSTYEAEVVLNLGSDSVEIRSNRIQLNPGAIRVTHIDVKDGDKGEKKVPVQPGKYATMLATTEPVGRSVVWSIRMSEDGVRAKIDSVTGQVYADPETESGWIVVRATDAENDCVYKEAGVFIGCSLCADAEAGYCSLNAASGFVRLSSIDVGMSLGKARGGQSAGDLFLRSDYPSSEVATPRSLLVSTLSSEVEERFTEDDVIRQIMAPDAFVDIITLDAFSFEVIFYDPADVTGEVDGLYTIDGAAIPLATWRIANPDASTETYNRLEVTETRDGSVSNHAYLWDGDTGTWSLSSGGGLQIITRQETTSGSDKIVVETIADDLGSVARVTRTTYRTFDWGEEIVETVVDPDGAALTTTTSFYTDSDDTGSYGRVNEVLYPDGSWVRYEYDEQGRKALEVRPWLDAAPGTAPEAAKAIRYDYTPVDPLDTGADEDRYTPRTTTETILGVDAGRSYFAVYTGAGDERVEVRETCPEPSATYGDAANLRTVTTYNPSGTNDAGAGRMQSVAYPDGRLDLYTYEYGSYTDGATADVPGNFTAGTGDYRRESVLLATTVSPAGIAFQSTRQASVFSPLGNPLLETAEVYTGSGFERLSWTIRTYDGLGRVLTAYHSNGTQEDKTWSCCNLLSEQRTQGEEILFSYDALKRVKTSTQTGIGAGTWPAQVDVVATYTYDAVGNTLAETTVGGGISLNRQKTFDLAGRLETTIDAAGLLTTYVYDAPARETTVVQPGGGTETTTLYRDGRVKSVTGTAVVPQYYEYGVNADGSKWTRFFEGSLASTRWQQTTVDTVGRTATVERSGYAGTLVERSHYNALGQLVRVEKPGQADTIMEYDALSNPVREGLDIDRNGLLEVAGVDRITDTATVYTTIGSDWWQQTDKHVYAEDNDGTPTTVAVNRARLTGLGTYASETVSIDIHGNETTARTQIDRALKQVTQLTVYPESATDGRKVTINGRLVASRNKSGVETTFAYDDVGRQIQSVDPRKGAAVIHYNDKGQVDYVADAAVHQTDFTYDTDSGRKITETNDLGQVTRYLYNLRGQVTHTWGDAVYPVHKEYDAFGRLERMHTYRGGSGWSNAVWPTGMTGDADTTVWVYQEASGLLTAKQDAAGEQVTYTYDALDRLETRVWARTDAGSPITTTYAFDPDSGELVGIDYSDTTPDITFDYDRLGRQREITDAVGTRTFTYNAALQLESETVGGLYTHTLTRTYDTTTVPGRSTGFNVDGSHTVTYDYDTFGRFDSVGWNIGGNTGAADYTYLTNSDRLESMTSGSFQVGYTYEPQRDLRTRIENRYGAQVVSAYEYAYDPIGRRTSVKNSGTAFAASAFNRYHYNNRSELTASNRYLGTDTSDLSQPVAPEARIYDYDPIGNRTMATENASDTIYTANELNQYDSVTTGGASLTLDYDADGNLIAQDGVTYRYNAENRLIAVEPTIPVENDKRVAFLYDYMGRRVKKTVYVYGSGAWNTD